MSAHATDRLDRPWETEKGNTPWLCLFAFVVRRTVSFLVLRLSKLPSTSQLIQETVLFSYTLLSLSATPARLQKKPLLRENIDTVFRNGGSCCGRGTR